MKKKAVFLLFLLAFGMALSAEDGRSSFYLKYKEMEKSAIESMKKADKQIADMAGFNWSHSDEGRKQWQVLLCTALKERQMWGEYENGERCPFSLFTDPFFTDEDGKKYENPLVTDALQLLSKTRRFQDDKELRRESVRNVIAICRNKDYTYQIRPWLMKYYLFRELARDKWDAELQTLLKREIIKGAIDGNEYHHYWLMFYWFLDWTDEEKGDLLNALRPIVMQVGKKPVDTSSMTPFERRERLKYEWLALLILCDNNDDGSWMQLDKKCSSIRYDDYQQIEARRMFAFLPLVRRNESITILGNLLEHLGELINDDDDDVKKEDVDKNGGLANFIAQCLMLMIYDMPSAYDESLASEDDDFYCFPKGRRMEIVEWLKARSTFRFKPIDNMLHYDNGMVYDETFFSMKFEDKDEDMDRYFHIIGKLNSYLWW